MWVEIEAKAPSRKLCGPNRGESVVVGLKDKTQKVWAASILHNYTNANNLSHHERADMLTWVWQGFPSEKSIRSTCALPSSALNLLVLNHTVFNVRIVDSGRSTVNSDCSDYTQRFVTLEHAQIVVQILSHVNGSQ